MSKWDKLIMQICNLSKDIRFDELRKVLESYGDEMNSPKEAVIIHSESVAVCQLQYQSMNRSKKYM